MPTKANNSRDTTDESLRTERRKTDVQLERSLGAIERDADQVLSEAREKADSVLEDARGLQDERLVAEGLSPKQTAGVAEQNQEQRTIADAALTAERDDADIDLKSARVRRQLALAALLAFERHDTDLRLGIERAHADAALTSREDVLGMVSHDLRSLLGGIALSAELLSKVARAEGHADKIARHAERIQRFTASMNRLIGDLVDAASINAGKLTLVPERHDAAQLIRNALEAFQPAAAAQGIELTCEIPTGPTFAVFDYERILQVLTNLVGNALKFTPRGGRVSLRVMSRDDGVQFAVTDTGVGISPERLDKIFDRFFQADTTDRRGLGLGLFISKSIVEAHGGRLWVESKLGSGSTFWFSLPASSQLPSAG